MCCRIIIVAVCAIFFSGCAGLRDLPHITTNELARNISDNAANINEAQSRATSAIIVKNILRARDRWPTSYSTLSGVSSNPQIVFSAEASLTPLGLGNPPMPFGDSGAKLSQDNTATASYQVNPFSEQNGGENIFKPIPRELFKEYWDAGYPKDILLMLFVASVEKDGCVYANDIDSYTSSSKSKADCKTGAGEQHLVINSGDSGNEQTHFLVEKDFRHIISPLLGGKCSDFLKANQIEYSNQCLESKKYQLQQAITHDLTKCPVIQAFSSAMLFNADSSQKPTVLDRIKTLSDLKGGEVHLDVVEICAPLGEQSDIYLRDCKSTEKKEQYEFRYTSPESESVTSSDNAQMRCRERRAEVLSYLLGSVENDNALREKDSEKDIKFELRSIDSMVYFLGEYLRLKELGGDAAPFYVVNSANLGVINQEAESLGNKATYILSVSQKDLWRYQIKDPDDNFAVSVSHGGERYYAAQKIICRENDKECASRLSEIDRTGTVLSILSQLFIRSQSKEFLKAPETSVLRTQ